MKTSQSNNKKRTSNPFISTMIIVLVALLIIAVATCFIPEGANKKLIFLIACIVFVLLFISVSYIVHFYSSEKNTKQENNEAIHKTDQSTKCSDTPIPDIRQEDTVFEKPPKLLQTIMEKLFRKGKK